MQQGKSIVSVKRAGSYDDQLIYEAVRDCLSPLGGISAFVQPGQRVLLKPNLIAPFSPERAATTHPAVVHAVAKLCLEAGAEVSVGDSPGVGSLAFAFKQCGIEERLRALEKVQLADFDHAAEFELPENTVARKLALAKAVQDADVLISLPKLKTHGQMTFTGALKNQFGLVLGTRKAQYHYRLKTKEWLAALMIDINRTAKPALAIMDAVVAMEGQGPSSGEPRFVGALLAGADLTAVDVAACKLIGVDAVTTPLVSAAARYGFGTSCWEQIEVVGDSLEQLAVPDFKQIVRSAGVLRLLALPPFVLSWIEKKWAPWPYVMSENCTGCNACRRGCPVSPAAIEPSHGGSAAVDRSRCIRCYCCHEFCPHKAIDLEYSMLGRLFRR